MKRGSCASCAHFNSRADVSPTVGECRRYPPTPFQEPRQSLQAGAMRLVIVAYYPPTVTTEWCSEYAASLIAGSVAN